LRVGYARAARLVDMREQQGFISGFDGSKARKVLIKRAEYEALFASGEGAPPESPEAPPEV
ncbi:MAG: DNA translocase FtsK, partial [Clostridia bacterium]|nr:DNA translocase FtsK [Clostridia bacterium]